MTSDYSDNDAAEVYEPENINLLASKKIFQDTIDTIQSLSEQEFNYAVRTLGVGQFEMGERI